MKRSGLSLFLVLFSFTLINAQAYGGKMEYEKKKQEAVIIEYNYPQEAVENAIISKIESMGNQAKTEKGVFNKDKGCIVFKNATVTDISSEMLTYIVKIERKSRKEADETILSLVINNKDGEDMLSKGEVNYTSNAKTFLNTLSPEIETAHLEIKIKDQETTVTKAQKKFKDLQDSQASLEKKIKGLQDDLKANAKDQEAQQKEIEVQQQALEGLKVKRK
jgi:hypothetical protein